MLMRALATTVGAVALTLAMTNGCGSATGSDTEVSPPAAAQDGQVALELRAAAGTYRAALRNGGDEPLTLVLPGDGSSAGWRTPLLRWYQRDGDSVSELAQRHPTCGNINALAADEVVTLAPGDEVELGDWLGRPPVGQPGRYVIAVEYANVPRLEWQGLPLGQHDPEAMQRVRASTPLVVRSNFVAVDITDAGP